MDENSTSKSFVLFDKKTSEGRRLKEIVKTSFFFLKRNGLIKFSETFSILYVRVYFQV